MTLRTIALLALLLGLAACGGNPTQVLLTSDTPELRLRPIVSSLEVRDISLPRYAASDTLVVRGAGNSLEPVGDTIWADNPERAMTLQLATQIATITQARVAAEPWPFAGLPSAQVTVRIEQLLGSYNGTLRMAGYYAIAPVDSALSDRYGQFNIVVPMPGEGADALVAAQAQALGDLSELIARRLSR